MSAAALAEQPTLAGIEPPPLAEQPVHFAVMGLLREDARVFARPGCITVLRVVVAQHLQQHPEARHIVADYVYPDLGCPNATAAAAHDKAGRLAMHDEVVLRGTGLEPCLLHGERVLRLIHCIGIERADSINPQRRGGTACT
jgi:hypothetical protein